MLLFRTVVNNFEVLGIGRKQNSLSRKFLMNFIVYWLLSIWATVSLLCRDHNFHDYLEYIYLITSNIVLIVSYAIIGLKQAELFELIDISEEIIRKSKWFPLELVELKIWTAFVWLRTQGSVSESILRWSQSTNWKMDQTRLYVYDGIDAIQLLRGTADYQLYILLCHRAEIRYVRCLIFTVVSWSNTIETEHLQ